MSKAKKFWLGFSDVPEDIDEKLNKFLSVMEKLVHPHEDTIYIEPNYDFTKNNKSLLLKISDESIIDKIVNGLSKYNFEKSTKGYNSKSIVKVSINLTGGDRGSGVLPRKGQEGETTPSTEQQEAATVFILNSFIEGKEVSIDEINENIGYEFDDSWMHTFNEQLSALKNTDIFSTLPKIHLDSDKNDSNEIVYMAKKSGAKRF